MEEGLAKVSNVEVNTSALINQNRANFFVKGVFKSVEFNSTIYRGFVDYTFLIFEKEQQVENFK